MFLPLAVGMEHTIVSGRIIQLVPGAEPYPGYRLVHLLGKGGWSDVWKARQENGGTCALKFMPCDPGLAPSKEVRALQALHHIKHRYLLEIRNIWSCPGFVVIVMDLCDGSLLDLLEVYLRELEEPMSADHVCYFLGQAAEAIDFLNARQHLVNGQRMAIRHCDVKPSNLLLLGKNVMLADFSLAVPTTATLRYHRRDGTPMYCAPEVFQGCLSDRSDQYALAVTYYQLRTGLFPFPVVSTTNDKNYVRPAPNLSALPSREADVLLRALAAVPQDRWASCVEMMQRLHDACGVPVAVA
jgi:serine/threonine protein kinase, bacterial